MGREGRSSFARPQEASAPAKRRPSQVRKERIITPFPANSGADQMPDPPREGQLMCDTLSKHASINNKENNLIAEYTNCSRPTQHCTRRVAVWD